MIVAGSVTDARYRATTGEGYDGVAIKGVSPNTVHLRISMEYFCLIFI
jgi:hypothetical protein